MKKILFLFASLSSLWLSASEPLALDEAIFKDCRFLSAMSNVRPSKQPFLATGSKDFKVELPQATTKLEVSVKDFGASPSLKDNTEAFKNAIEHCKKVGASRLIVPKGTYYFRNERSSMFIYFDGFKDFTFDGGGSTFIFHRQKPFTHYFHIRNSYRILLKNFNVDWDWEIDPIGSYVKLVNLNKPKDFADFEFIDYKTFPKRNIRVASIHGTDPKTKSTGNEKRVRVSFNPMLGWKQPAAKTEWLSGNVLRIYSNDPIRNSFKHLKFQVGDLYIMRHWGYDGFAIWLKSNQHLTLQNVNIYSSTGTGIRISGSQQYTRLFKVNFVRPPYGPNRPITTACDALHAQQSKGFMKIIDCKFEFCGDDCINVYDSGAFGEKINARTIRAKVRYATYSELKVGHEIELRNENFSPTGFSGKLAVDRKTVSGKPGYFDLTLDKNIPGKVGDLFILYNREYGSDNIIIRDCTFANNRGRGVLVQGNNFTLEGNSFFHTKMHAIMIRSGFGREWTEGMGAANILIKGNRFEQVGIFKIRELFPSIHIGVFKYKDPSIEKTAYPVFKNILIEKNQFSDCHGALIYASSFENLVVKGNSISRDNKRRKDYNYAGAIGVEYGTGIYVYDNLWKILKNGYIPHPGVFFERSTTKGVFCWNNQVIRKAAD